MDSSPPAEPCDRVSTRALLTATAERLFAEKGMEGVSLRAISAAAGQANNVAVQYHFNDRRGLITAIISGRLVDFERRRGELLAAVAEEGRALDARGLVEILFRPMSETLDEQGRNVHARFLLHFTTEADRWMVVDHPINAWLDAAARDGASPTVQALDMLAERLDPLPPALVRQRISHLMRMFLGALIERENAIAYGRPAASLEQEIQEQLNMITAALVAAPLAR
jgi:AcrR family transcriptional regulator